MKVVVGIIIGLLALGGGLLLWLAGFGTGLRHNFKNKLQEMGLTRQSAALYGRAVRLLERLHQENDLAGAMAGDLLSPETKKLVADWLTDHRKKDR